jgi:hypothetical protein
VGARFENPPVPDTIGRDLLSSVQSQSLTEKSEEMISIKHAVTLSGMRSEVGALGVHV